MERINRELSPLKTKIINDFVEEVFPSCIKLHGIVSQMEMSDKDKIVLFCAAISDFFAKAISPIVVENNDPEKFITIITDSLRITTIAALKEIVEK